MEGLEELKNELNKYFKAYVTEFTTIKNHGGKKISCLFPDHEDNNPSMILNENHAFCFKCGTMDIFRAAHEFEGKPLRGKEFVTENILYLAKKFGIRTKTYNSKKMIDDIKEKDNLLFFFRFLEKYIGNIKENEEQIAYTTKRGIKSNLLKFFCISFIDYYEVEKEFKKINSNFDISEMKKYGFTPEHINKNKMFFLIKDQNGTPVSFAVRETKFIKEEALNLLVNKYKYDIKELQKLKNKDIEELSFEDTKITNEDRYFIKKSLETAKYINGNNSYIYDKGKTLYNLNFINPSKIGVENIIAVEGYLDSIIAIINGLHNTISYNSSTLTDEQIKKLKGKIIFFPDNDSTGKEKIKELVKKTKEQDLSCVKVAFFKKEYDKYKDLAEFFLENNNEKIENFADLLTLYEAQVKVLLGEGTDKTKIIKDVCTSISLLNEPVDRFNESKITYNYLLENNVLDNNFTFENFNKQVEFIHTFQKEDLTKKIKNEFFNIMKEIDNDPYSAITLAESLPERIKKNAKQLSIKKDFARMQLEALELVETKKKMERESYKFGYKFLDDIRLKEPGNFILLGKPQMGKTTLMINIATKLLITDKNSSVVFISRDDSYQKVLNSFITCMGGFFRSFSSDPYHHHKHGIYKSNISNANGLFSAYNNTLNAIINLMKERRLWIVGMESSVMSVLDVEVFLKEHSKDRKLDFSNKTVFIDSSSKLTTNSKTEHPEREISREIKRICLGLGYTSFQNYEIVKSALAKKRRNEMSDLSGGKEMQYDADLILRLTQPVNDLNSDKERYLASSTWDLTLPNGSIKKQPILVVDFPKIKVGDPEEDLKDKPFFFKMDTMKYKITEVTKDNDEYEKIKNNFKEDLTKYTRDTH